MRVIFRAERSGDFAGLVTAVFPDEPWYPPRWGLRPLMTCYVHFGQHASCDLGWYRQTRPATPEEYAPLLAELRGIYETGPDPVRLVIAKRR